MKSFFEKMGGTYRQEGDYLLPNLSLPPDSERYPLGKYGRMRQRYLKEHHRALYTCMMTDGTLWKHLAEIDRSCNDRLEIIETAMMKQESVSLLLRSLSFARKRKHPLKARCRMLMGTSMISGR